MLERFYADSNHPRFHCSVFPIDPTQSMWTRSSTVPRAAALSAALWSGGIYWIVQGRMQHWQSSPHQQGNLTGGFFTAPLLLAILAVDPAFVAEEVVEGGIAVAWRRTALRFS
ncbi:hypothetical protein DOTSEDRAFT_41257 [Dothistroma septosporum NZE10]|uniref:Uncharacterized protein n=1 Tax=Dothistroma septosporum (strain NZE10 / CBS 128990) TaxID=675120 RepID=N1Q4B0_DOTSN|nr:hypothetical protein DOTSEDRAFT_41257 [Dothistroma septosporum NZE10]